MHRPRRWFGLGLALAMVSVLSATTVKEQWSDLPEYAALIGQRPAYRTPPRLVSGEPPQPPAFMEPEAVLVVDVLIGIDEQGNVAAARVLKSDDPGLDMLAIMAVEKWKFSPAEGELGPVKAMARIPLRFVGAPSEEYRGIEVTVGEFSYDPRRHSLSAPVLLVGGTSSSIKGARIIVESAIDNTGAELRDDPPREFAAMAPGRIVAEPNGTVIPTLTVALRKPGQEATQLRSLHGTIEIIVPSLDPAASVVIDRLSTRLNHPCPMPGLAAAGITVTILDQDGVRQALADRVDPTGARDFLTNEFTASIPGWKIPLPLEKMNDTDVALAIHDPQGRLGGFEFQNAYGETLRATRWSRFDIATQKRFSLYRLDRKPTDDIKLVCWLVTPDSIVKKPVTLAGMSLPATR